MRYSIVFAALVAVATSAPIDVTVGGLDVSVGNVADATTTQTTTGKRGVVQVPDITINTPKINAKRTIGTQVSVNGLITSITGDFMTIHQILMTTSENAVAPVIEDVEALNIAVGLNFDPSAVTDIVGDIHDDIHVLLAGVESKLESLVQFTVDIEIKSLVAKLLVDCKTLITYLGLGKREVVSTAVGTVGGVVGEVEKTAGGVVKRQVDLNVDGLVGGAVKDVTSIVGNIKRDTVVDADNVINPATTTVGNVVADVKPITAVVGGVVADVKPVTAVVGNVKRDTVVDLDTALTPAMGAVSGAVNDVKPVTDVVPGVVSGVKRQVQVDGALNTVESTAGPIVGDATKIVGNLKRQFTLPVVGDLVTEVDSTVEGVVGNIKREVDLSEITGDVTTIDGEVQSIVPKLPVA